MNEQVKKWMVDNFNLALVFDFPQGWIATQFKDFDNYFGDVILQAIEDGKDVDGVKQAIRDSDPNNTLGFNDYI